MRFYNGAMQTIRQSRAWTPVQLRWLDRLGKQLRHELVLDHAFVMLHAGSAIHTFTMNAAAALGRHLDVRIQVRSFEAVCRMVGAGVGIGLVPRGAALQVAGLSEPPPPLSMLITVRGLMPRK